MVSRSNGIWTKSFRRKVYIRRSKIRKYAKKDLNLKVKYRESFRPFAPSVLKEDVSDWFNLKEESPYMLIVSKVHKNKQINMSSDQNKLFGIDKLNIKRSEIPATTT